VFNLEERRLGRTAEGGRLDAFDALELKMLERDPAGGSNEKEWWEALGDGAKAKEPSKPILDCPEGDVKRGSSSSSFLSSDIAAGAAFVDTCEGSGDMRTPSLETLPTQPNDSINIPGFLNECGLLGDARDEMKGTRLHQSLALNNGFDVGVSFVACLFHLSSSCF
jgi:hypothetical protein